MLAFLGALAAATALRAQDPSKAPVAAPPPASQPASQPASKPAAEPPAAAPSDEAATDRKPAGASSGRFEPTEKVRADFDVSFPVDI
jgi:hypothetical protein